MRDLIIEEMEPSHKTPKLKDWYVKPIEIITNNWVFIFEDTGVEVIFVRDDGVIFDTLKFENKEVAIKGLKENGFINIDTSNKRRLRVVKPRLTIQQEEDLENQIKRLGKNSMSKVSSIKADAMQRLENLEIY